MFRFRRCPISIVTSYEVADLDEIWSYINPQMLYGRHMGLRGRFNDLIAAGDRRAIELEEKIERVKEECRQGAMRVRVVWQFFEAEPEGNRSYTCMRVRALSVSPA